MSTKHAIADLPQFTTIYYTGDVANQSGLGEVTAVHEPTRWIGPSVTIRLNDGRLFRRVEPSEFDVAPGRRFWIKAEYDAHRTQQIAQMKADFQALAARRLAEVR